jgi:hypothetical protein
MKAFGYRLRWGYTKRKGLEVRFNKEYVGYKYFQQQDSREDADRLTEPFDKMEYEEKKEKRLYLSSERHGIFYLVDNKVINYWYHTAYIAMFKNSEVAKEFFEDLQRNIGY